MRAKKLGWTTLLLFASMYAASPPDTLSKAYQGKFVIGVAVNEAQISGRDARGAAIVAEEFNSISPENALKWESIHPEPGEFSFDVADRYVDFGEKHHMFIVGHTLIWHNQTPAWVFHDSSGQLVDRETLLKRMHEHISSVVGRYRGRINSWDVVNEALNDDGSLRQTLWLKIIGEDYIAKAFQYAHEADPHAQLTYNDYSLENPAKRRGALALIRRLKSEGVTIDTVGLQCHISLAWPSTAEEDETIKDFAAAGVKVAITELDVDVLPPADTNHSAEVTKAIKQNAMLNPYSSGLPEKVDQELAARYASLFRIFLRHRDAINRVTFWGVTDGDSWLNDWPVQGRTSYPLLFGRDGQPKAAFESVINARDAVNP